MESAQWREEQKRRKKAAERAIEDGLEILTPSGAAFLFGKSMETIRKARRAEPGEAVAFELCIEARPIHMLRLQWAAKKWANDLNQERLEEMRSRLHTFGAHMGLYLILHDKPIDLTAGSQFHDPGIWEAFEAQEEAEKEKEFSQ